MTTRLALDNQCEWDPTKISFIRPHSILVRHWPRANIEGA